MTSATKLLRKVSLSYHNRAIYIYIYIWVPLRDLEGFL